MTQYAYFSYFFDIDPNMFETCIRSLRSVSKDVIIVICADDGIPKEFKEHLSRDYNVCWDIVPLKEITRRRASCKIDRLGVLLSDLPEGEQILIADVDIYFLDDPFAAFAESEFDVVFTSPEGRFLGEVEGKDNKAVNIDKLSQLERNLQEDFAREEVEEYAKGVLFGNAYRLRLPSERSKFFTKKCISGAKRSKVALVRTPDLFEVAKYLREHNAPAFAQKCREAIMQAEGEVVNFPKVPAKAVETKKEESKSL